MQRIDAHQHFWQFDPVRDSWINDEMAVIQKDFLPTDIEPVLQQNNIAGCVTVQSDQSETENEFQLNNAGNFDFIKGVVGWVNLQSEDIEDRLAYYSSYKKMKGFRHVLQGEADRALMLKPAFMNGIAKLQQFRFTYDILIFPDQLKYATELVAAFPGQKFVLDHIAKPVIKEHEIVDWKRDISALAKYQNCHCKISGMVTEADWKNWKKEDFNPYLDTVVNAFGTDRIMFGSDWPVCLVAASYAKMLAVVTDYFSSFTNNEQEKFFGSNAIEFYNL
ncbi:MAG: amidohydrolase family protein [Ferruginibacter sp.]